MSEQNPSRYHPLSALQAGAPSAPARQQGCAYPHDRSAPHALRLALVLGTALFLIANYRIFTPTSLRTLGSYIAAGIRSHDAILTTIN